MNVFLCSAKPQKPGAAHLRESDGDCSCHLQRSFKVERRLERSEGKN